MGKTWVIFCLALPLLAAAIWPPPRSIQQSGSVRKLCRTLDLKSPQSAVLDAAIQRARPLLVRKATHLATDVCLGQILFDVKDTSEQLMPDTRYDYQLEIKDEMIRIESETVFGAMYALESLVQLAASNSLTSHVLISDAPLYDWRGLMLDSGRRFFPVKHVESLLDTMAAVKLNVLHLHASDMCRFGVQSKLYPNLTDSLTGIHAGSYTQEDVASLVAYAHARGIRVVPEFDIPGHSRGFIPVESAGAQFCSADDTRSQLYGDPQNRTYNLLHGVLKEMAGLFPDPVFHIGCDETGVLGPCTLSSTFNLERRVLTMIESELGKTPAGWEEVFFDAGAATPNTIVFTWSRHHPAEVTSTGRRVVENAGSHFYFTDPGPTGPSGWERCWYNISTGVPPAQQSLVLGGEMSMWTDTYCYISQCGASKGSQPVGSALFGPASDQAFQLSIGGMVWPRGLVGAAAFWGYDASVDPASKSFVDNITAISNELLMRGLPVCPPGCYCDQMTACGIPYQPHPTSRVGLARCVAATALPAQRWTMDQGKLCLLANTSLCLALPAPNTYPATLALAAAATALAHTGYATLTTADNAQCVDVEESDGSVGSFSCGSDQANQQWALDPVTHFVVLLGNYGDDRDAHAGLCLTALN